jgi:hypothetical protein
MKYIVRLEANVSSVDLADVEVEASSKEEAIQKAIQGYTDGSFDLDWYASDTYELELDTQFTQDWLVEEA